MEESPPFKYEGQILNRKLIASVSNVLDIAGIPSVLWGPELMNVHGIPLSVFELDFVVPDEDLDRAYQVLLERGFPACSMGQDCLSSPESNDRRAYPAAPRHLHMDEHDELALLLHKKSEALWAVPTFTPFSHKENPEAKIILASDHDGVPKPNLHKGTGPYPESLFPARIPSAHCLMEAYVLLSERDFDENCHGFAMPRLLLYGWDLMILNMIRHREGHPGYPLIPNYIDPRCRELYHYFTTKIKDKAKFGSERDVMRRLRKAIQESK